MATLKIWGRKTSSNVQKVLWCCDELGIPFERVDIGGPFGGNDDPQYRALNPNGLVPTVEDNGLVLWESNSIIRYLARKYGKGALYPQDPAAAATAERWMDWQLAHLNPALVPIFFAYVRTPPEKRDMAAIEAARQRTIPLWRMVDAQLAKGPYLNGEQLSLADMPCGIWAYRWHTMPIERPELPHLAAWYKRLCARPPYRSHIMIPLE
ncbi:MAG: glutathione S-transferase family protein [Alphaproteobacteria bacterium]